MNNGAAVDLRRKYDDDNDDKTRIQDDKLCFQFSTITITYACVIQIGLIWFGRTFRRRCMWNGTYSQLFSSKPFGFYFHEIVPSSLSNNFNLKYAL